MGSAEGRPDESPQHPVEIGPFELGLTPVTNREYAPCIASGRVEAPPWWNEAGYCSPDQPVVGVTWFDAVTFLTWLGEESGGRWRLPAECEWEWAMRGGLSDAPTAWGERLPENEIPEGRLSGPWPVARGTPNGFGLFDPGTLVHEWCLDWYAAGYYAVSPRNLPRGPDEGERRASRGGSWRHHVRWSSPAARSSLEPHRRYSDYGFRVLREVAEGGAAAV
jgi:formylglycine-generating enzyme required for sulfatase activity